MWTNTFKLALKALVFEKERKAYEQLSWFKKLFAKAPVAPSDKTWQQLCVQYMEEFNDEHGNLPRFIEFGWQKSPKNIEQRAYPILSFWAYENGCYYVTRQAFKLDGTTEEWGCPYPYSECGLTGRLNQYGKNDYDAEYKLFDRLVEEIRRDIV